MKLAYRLLGLVQLIGVAGLGYNHLFFVHDLTFEGDDHGDQGFEGDDHSVLFAAMICIGILKIFLKYMRNEETKNGDLGFYHKSINYAVFLDVVSVIVFLDYILFDFVFP